MVPKVFPANIRSNYAGNSKIKNLRYEEAELELRFGRVSIPGKAENASCSRWGGTKKKIICSSAA